MHIKSLFVAALLVLLAGCSKVTAENYQKLEAGMTRDEVVAVLGQPASCESALGFESCRFGDDKTHIKVKLVADRVVSKSAEGL